MARLSGFHLEGGIGKTMLDLVYPVNSLYLTAGSSQIPAARRTTTCRLGSPCTCGGAPRDLCGAMPL